MADEALRVAAMFGSLQRAQEARAAGAELDAVDEDGCAATLDEDGDNNIDKHEFLRQMRAVQNERRRRARAARGTTNGNSVSSTPVATGPLRRTRQSRAERASAAKKKHIDRLRELS